MDSKKVIEDVAVEEVISDEALNGVNGGVNQLGERELRVNVVRPLGPVAPLQPLLGDEFRTVLNDKASIFW